MEELNMSTGSEETPFPGGTSANTSMSKAGIEITNRRYQSDPFWGGPKGNKYGLLVGALPIQQPPLYPDQGSAYFVGNFKMPPNTSLTIKGTFGHLRYFSFTIATQLGGGQIGNGDFIRDDEIVPDAGSVNPFADGNARDATPRNYTLTVLQGKAPKNRPPNTLYTGSDSYEARVHLALRNYIADAQHDGTGNATLEPGQPYGLPTVYLNLPDGRQITGEEMAVVVQASKARETAGYTREQWLSLVKSSWDETNAPAVPAPAFQRFWNTDYNVTGSFIRDPAERVSQFPADNSGGFANNPDTIYLSTMFSLDFGQVVVIKGKMPSFPRTRRGNATLEQGTQVRYWSLSTGGAAPSGVGWASIFDEEIPLDDEGNYTIVMSWPEDRPKNAVRACGVKWVDFGGGEGHYVGARAWMNVVYIRYMAPQRGDAWPESPVNIPQPTEAAPEPLDAEVMKAYYPRATYTSKADFETFGPQG